MQKFRKRLLTAVLAAVIAVSAASLPVWSDSEEEPVDTASGDAAAQEAIEEDSGVFVTEAEAFENMKKYAENSKLALYVNEKDCSFAIEDKATGYKWWSSYVNCDPSGSAKVKASKRKTVLSIDVVGTESKTVETSVRAYESSVGKKHEKIDGGVRFTFTFPKYDIDVPLEIKLNDDGSFTATVPQDLINERRPDTIDSEHPGYVLLNVHVLENLAATGRDKNGMIVVPDGSGAVINYNNGAPSGDNNTYEAKVYGEDIAVGKLFAGAIIEKVTMPVMATLNTDDGAGLVMISTKGEMYASAHAMVTGQNVTDLNSCWFEYSLRTTDKYFMGNKNEPLTVFEAKGIKTGDVSTTYYPIYGNDLTFVDVVAKYKEYLSGTVGVQEKKYDNTENAPFYLTLYGGTVKKQSVMGFPVDIQTEATTYKQAIEILEQLEASGVTNIKVVYEDFNDAGVVGEVAAVFQYSSMLGGKGDYEKLKAHIAEKGYEIFPSCDIMEFYKSGNGYSFTLNSSKQITMAYATQTPFELAFGLPHLTKSSWTILSPYYFTDIFNKLGDSFTAEGSVGISLNQASNLLYSDFSRENAEGRAYIVRGDTINILTEGYRKLKDRGMKIMTENANQYILPYADYIKDVPLYSSNYDIFDYDIPFVEMVYHGTIPYTTKAINRSANAEQLRLLALVTGTPIHYEMMYNNPNVFADSEYDYLYYTNYQGWMERSTNEYKLFNDIVKNVVNCKITNYERLSDCEYQSTFDNGDTIYVNIETGAVKYNDKSYDVKDYGLGVTEYE